MSHFGNPYARQHGKRVNEEGPKTEAGLGPKKGRSQERAAFGDITNRESRLVPYEKPSNELQVVAKEVQVVPFHPQEAARLRTELVPEAGRDWVDIDENDHEDLMACTEYADVIMGNLFIAERIRRPSTCYMETVQKDVNQIMRSILVDWLVEVALEYKLVSDTFFLAVNYIDRFLSTNNVARQKLQLVGVTCMLLASKYEEIYAPQIDDFCYITDGTYTREEMIDMETRILDALAFTLTVPTPKSFLRRFLKAAAVGGTADPRLEFLAAYLCELTLPEYGALNFLASQIAASSVLLAQYILGRPHWSPTLQHYTTYQPHQLKSCIIMMHHVFVNARISTKTAIRDKYADPRYMCVSALATDEMLPEKLFWNNVPGSGAARLASSAHPQLYLTSR